MMAGKNIHDSSHCMLHNKAFPDNQKEIET